MVSGTSEMLDRYFVCRILQLYPITSEVLDRYSVCRILQWYQTTSEVLDQYSVCLFCNGIRPHQKCWIGTLLYSILQWYQLEWKVSTDPVTMPMFYLKINVLQTTMQNFLKYMYWFFHGKQPHLLVTVQIFA